MSRRRYVVMKSWRDVGPTIAPGWRLWSGWVEDRRHVHETSKEAEDREPALRAWLQGAGLTVVLVNLEPICDHDLSAMDEDVRSAHLFEPPFMGGCDQTYLAANVRLPARDPQHAYEQVCRAVGIEPAGKATNPGPQRDGLTSIQVVAP